MSNKINLSFGDRTSDFIASLVRSWKFIIFQFTFIFIWILVNSFFGFDKYPFDLLKLILTIEASFIGSIILMTQNKRADQDRRILWANYIIELQIEKDLKKIIKKEEK